MALSKLWVSRTQDIASGTVLTTASFDSTGYTHLVVSTRHEGATTSITPSDNKGSTGWSSLTKQQNSVNDLWAQMHWVKIGTAGTGHTVTMTLGAARAWRGIHVWLVSSGTGELALDVESVATGTTAAVDAGSLVTTTATVSFMSVAPYNSEFYTAGGGWTLDFSGDNTSPFDDNSCAQSRADASGTLDPVCTGSAAQDWAAVSASFKESGGGGANNVLAWIRA